MHRDLDNRSTGMAIQIDLHRGRLIVANPGGLYGITVVTRTLAEEGLPPAYYVDAGIRFTVLLRRAAFTTRSGDDLNQTDLQVYDVLAANARTVAGLQGSTELTVPNIRHRHELPRLSHAVGGRGWVLVVCSAVSKRTGRERDTAARGWCWMRTEWHRQTLRALL
ncbi:hypothetical protein LUW76_20180 [Actinomadura madurae]|uniref:hypothetical protein n=1 Tax=Actinomadura madurae TaxID=1993 RepID=UPI002026754A|nr:hypothetical protein [Actinomadura madurae]URM96462.1 hypothetical protein LUW76_20180 [Actinomadura madurae]